LLPGASTAGAGRAEEVREQNARGDGSEGLDSVETLGSETGEVAGLFKARGGLGRAGVFETPRIACSRWRKREF
jgi:hypothetical protein